MPPTLTLDEAAAVLKTHPDTVADCIAHRGLPAAKVGRAWVLVLDDVIDWLRTQYKTKETPECDSTHAARLAPGTDPAHADVGRRSSGTGDAYSLGP